MTLKHIKIVTKSNGRQFRYFAAPGMRLVRLPDGAMDTPEFLLAYAQALATAKKDTRGTRPATGSIAAAIAAWQSSDVFLALAVSTRIQRRHHLSRIAEVWGTARMSDLRQAHIEADLEGLAPHPARTRLKAWRGLCDWARQKRLIASDPAQQVTRISIPKSDGHVPWAADEISKFRDHWQIGTPQRLAMELVYWTAARASDAVRIGPGMITRAGWLTFKQRKTGGEVSVPFARALPDFAAGMQVDLDYLKAAIAASPRHMTWLVTTHGSARSDKAFSSWFSGAAAAAGIEGGKSAHGLRKARAMTLAEAGATVHQIAAWTGHESLSEVQRYSKAADRRRILSSTQPEQILETATIHVGNHIASN